MSFSRTHLFDAIQWDVQNLEFAVFVPTPTDIYGDGTNNIMFNNHLMPENAYAYLQRDKLYFHADRAANSGLGLYENTTGAETGDYLGASTGKMPLQVFGHPAMEGYMVYKTADGSTFGIIGDQTLEMYGMEDYKDTEQFAALTTVPQTGGFPDITSVRIGPDVMERFAALDGREDVSSISLFASRLQSFKTKFHKIWPGWTWNDEDENSFLRAHLIWAPYKKVTHTGLGEDFYNKPFEGIYRIMTAIPIGPPLRSHSGFYSRHSDFHHLITYRIFGYSVSPTGGKSIHPLIERNMDAGSCNMIVSEALLGNNPPKPYDVNIPSSYTYNNFVKYLQPSSEQINAKKMDTGEVPIFYTGATYGTFSISYAFAYNTINQSWYNFGPEHTAGYSKIHSAHPRNPYAGAFRGSAFDDDAEDDSEPKKYSGFLFMPSALISDEEAIRNAEMMGDSRLFYKHQVDNFKSPAADNNVNENRYDVAYVKSGRFGINNGLIKTAQEVFADSSYDRDQGQSHMKYINPKKVDTDSIHVYAHKLFSPRPLNGEALSKVIPFSNSYEVYMTHDDNAWPNIQCELDSAEYSRLTDNQKAVHASVKASLDNYNNYRMYWSNSISSNPGALRAEARDRRTKLMYYGKDTLTIAAAFHQIAGFVMKLNQMWTYDDTPKEARIRMQESGKLDSSIFSSISDSTLDMEMEEVYTEFLGRQMLQDRMLSLGGTFTEGMVREAEERMGVEEGTYDSRIGTATELGSARGDY